MNTLTNDEFAARVLEYATPGEFTPSAYYDPAGDCVEFLARPDDFYAERVDDLVTVYYSEKTNEIIGSLLKGVSRLCADLLKRYPGLKIEICHGKIKLVHIFQAKLWAENVDPEALATITYQKIIEVALRTGVEVQLEPAA